jgi:uncharacterized membrane protein YeaQ/YmgE (transglycosylase-associated protein family)
VKNSLLFGGFPEMSATGQLMFYIYMGIIAMIATLIGKKILETANERKGLIGIVFACYFGAFILWWFAGDIAMTLSVGRSDIYLIAICTAILPTVIWLVRNRESVKKTYSIGTTTTRKSKSAVSKAKSKVRRN